MADIYKLDIAKIKHIIREMYITESSYIHSFTLLLNGYIDSLTIVADTFEDAEFKEFLKIGKDGHGGIRALQAILTKTQLAIVAHAAKIENFMKGINFEQDWDEKFAYHLMPQVAAVFSQEATSMPTSYTEFVTHYDKINYQNKHLLKKIGVAKLDLITYWFRVFQTKLYDDNTDFKLLIKELATSQPQLALHTNQLDFDSIISLPIQRILKYKLFFNDLLKELGSKKSSQYDHKKTIRWLELASNKIQLVSILVDRCLDKPRHSLVDLIKRRQKRTTENLKILHLEERIRKTEEQLCIEDCLGKNHHRRASSFDSSLTTSAEGPSAAELASLIPAQLKEKYDLYKTPIDGDEVFHAIFGEIDACNLVVCKAADDKRKEIASKIRQRSQLDYELDTQRLKLALASFIEKRGEHLPPEALELIASAADITITLTVIEQGRRQKYRFNEGQQNTVSIYCIEGYYHRKLPSVPTQQIALAAAIAPTPRHAQSRPVKPLPPPPTSKLRQEAKQIAPVPAAKTTYNPEQKEDTALVLLPSQASKSEVKPVMSFAVTATPTIQYCHGRKRSQSFTGKPTIRHIHPASPPPKPPAKVVVPPQDDSKATPLYYSAIHPRVLSRPMNPVQEAVKQCAPVVFTPCHRRTTEQPTYMAPPVKSPQPVPTQAVAAAPRIFPPTKF